MINNPYLAVFLYSALIYLLGLLVFLGLAPTQFKKYNLFLNLGLSWGFGNGLLISILYLFSFLNKLTLVNAVSFQAGLIIGLVSLVFLTVHLKIPWRFNKLYLLALTLLILFLLPLIKHSLWSPLNAWDALAIWVLKAKALLGKLNVIGNPFFGDPFYWFSHQDYPIGLPLMLNAFFRIVNFAHDQAAQFYLLLFYLNSLFLYLGAMLYFLKHHLHWLIKLLSLVILMTVPNFILFSHNGFADVPLSYFFLSASFLLADLYLMIDKNSLSIIPLAVLTALSSTTIKIEGYPFLMAYSLLLILAVFFNQQYKHINAAFLLKLGIVVLLGLFPVIAWEWLKYRLQIRGTFAQATVSTSLQNALKLILHTYLNELLDTSRYALTLITSVFIYILELAMLVLNRQFKTLLLNSLLGLQLASYTLIYLITPNPLLWQLSSSFPRLSLHLIPIMIMFIFYNYIVLCQTKPNSQ